MAGTRLDVMQTIKLQVDGVIHNIALTSTAAAKLMGGDPDTVTAVVNALRLTKDTTTETLTEDCVEQTSSEPLMGAISETVPEDGGDPLIQSSSQYLAEQLEYLIPPSLDSLVQTTGEQVIEPQTTSASETLPVDCNQESSSIGDDLLVYSSVDNLLENESCSEDEDGFKWTESATVTFLEQYKLMAHRFNNGREKKIHLWQELSRTMQQLGYVITANQLDWKWKSLRSRFRKARDGKTPAECFIYFEAMKELFVLEEMTNALPPVLQKSMMGNDGSAGGVMVWSEEATRCLISQYKLYEERFRGGKEKKKVLWNEIAGLLQDTGIKCTAEQAEGKWKSLLRAFRKAKTLGLQKKAFPFFAEMSEIQEDMESSELDYSFESQEQAEVQWTEDAINVLLEEYTSRRHRFKGDEKKKSLWLEIAEALNTHGFACTSEQAVGKWKTLVRAFRKAQTSEYSRVRFAFYHKMQDLIGDQNMEMAEHDPTELAAERMWTDVALKIFLTECQARSAKLLADRKKELWHDISKVLQASGYGFTADQIENKWKSVYRRYKKAKTSRQAAMRFPYYDMVEEIVHLYDHPESQLAVDDLWTDEAVAVFLGLYKEKKPYYSSTSKALWEDINMAMGQNGFSFTAAQIQYRWKKLVEQFKTAVKLKNPEEQFAYLNQIKEMIEEQELNGSDDASEMCAGIQCSCGESKFGRLDEDATDFEGEGIWSQKATEIFLEGCHARKTKLAEQRKHDLWEEISKELQANGFTLSPKQVENKWKSMYRKYKKVKMLGSPNQCFPYFSQMKSLIEMYEKKVEDIAVNDMWKPEVIEALIKEYTKRKKKFGRQVTKRFWDQVNAVLQAKGFNFTSGQVQYRWDMLLRHYRKAHQSPSPQDYFAYYNLMREVMEAEDLKKGECLTEVSSNCCHCGLVKKPFDGHQDGCLSCLGCSVTNMCGVCRQWPQSTWQNVMQCCEITIKKSPSTEQLQDADNSDQWTADAMQILLEEYKLRKDRFQNHSNDELWSEIVKAFKSRGYEFTNEQLEDKWKQVVKCYFTPQSTKLPSECHDGLKEILGEADDASYHRGLSRRLRARPKRKYPWGATMSDGPAPRSSMSRRGQRSSVGKQTISELNIASGDAVEVRSFLRNFVQMQIEVEERSFRRLKTAHENKIKSLNELLANLDDK